MLSVKDRYLAHTISEDAFVHGKMAFVSGPRQVGKSTLAKRLVLDANYFLYDDETFRRAWAKSPSSALEKRAQGPIALDEIHKDRRWKTKLKGVFDGGGIDAPILVTGSARLDLFRRGNDSLLGRYIPYRLHPFTVGERAQPPNPDAVLRDANVVFPWADLMALSGFPEPLLKGSQAYAHRWSRLRLDRLVLEDIRTLLAVGDLNAFRLLIDLLPERVGSLLSVNALHQDVGKAYATVRAWLAVLDALYYTFRIPPFVGRLNRALRAERKLYLYDPLRIPETAHGKRLENLAALHLLKACEFWTDSAMGEFDLRYARTKDGLEVDFVVLRDKQPWMLVECKTKDTDPAKSLIAMAKKLKPEHQVQLVDLPGFRRDYPAYALTVQGYDRFFSSWV